MSNTGRKAKKPAQAEGFLARDEEQALARRWLEEQDYEARARIIKAYDKMAISYARKASKGGLPFEDLLQEANMGLMEALDRFRPELGYGFGTFAVYYIISKIQIFCLENMGPMRIFNTATTKTLLSRYGPMKKRLEAESGQPLDDDGRALICEELKITREQLQRFETAVQSTVQVDIGAGSGPEEDSRPMQLATVEPSPEETVVDRLSRHQVLTSIVEVVEGLGDREAKIIMARHFSDPTVTLDALSKKFGISRERVRQIELRALNDMQKELERRGIDSSDALTN